MCYNFFKKIQNGDGPEKNKGRSWNEEREIKLIIERKVGEIQNRKNERRIYMINIKKVNCIEDAKICDELLTKLIQSERKFNKNIKSNYIVKGFFEKIYNNDNNVIFCAKIDKVIVGYIYCRFDSDCNGPMLHQEALIDGLYVKNEYRRRGIASNLIAHAKKWVKDKNIENLYINVLEGNMESMNLYYKNGFKNFEKKLKLGGGV